MRSNGEILGTGPEPSLAPSLLSELLLGFISGFLPSCPSGGDCPLAVAVVAGPGRVPWCQQGELASCLCCGSRKNMLGYFPSIFFFFFHLPFTWYTLSGCALWSGSNLRPSISTLRRSPKDEGCQMPEQFLQAAAITFVSKSKHFTWRGTLLTSRVNAYLNPLVFLTDSGWKAAARCSSSAVRYSFLGVFSWMTGALQLKLPLYCSGGFSWILFFYLKTIP